MMQGIVDGSDLSMMDNDTYNAVQGYVTTDLNGDNFVDGSDLAIANNNSYNVVMTIRP